MKRTTIDLSPERQIITNMIVSEQFLKEILPVFKIELLESSYAKLVAGWILEYYKKYETAPEKNIQDIYYQKKKGITNEDDADNIAEFLKKLSKDYEDNSLHNVSYSINEGVRYLKLQSLQILKERIDHALASGDPLKGEHEISNFKRVEKSTGEGVNLMMDAKKIANAFLEESELLFSFPGAFGEVCGALNRGDFMAYLAPMKRGKTWLMWASAEQALLAGLRVVFFTLEMTENQMVRRAWQSLTAHPRKTQDITISSFEETQEDGETLWRINTRTEKREGVKPESIPKDQEILRRMYRNGEIRIISAWGASVDDLNAHLDNLAHYENYVADVVIIDYADILAPSPGFRGEYRHQIDDIWKRLRKMAQARFCGVITASQAERSTLKGDVNETSVSEDIRKLAHVTSMIGLNQTRDEKEKGIMRISQLVVREGRQNFTQALVLQALDIGKAVLDSRDIKKVILSEDDDDENLSAKSSKTRTRNRK